MTSIANYRTEFGGITGMGGPLPVPLIAVAGPRHTILHATKSGGQVVLLGESADLDAETLAVENSSSPNFHVLTTAGVTRVSNANSPQIVSTHPFNPGGGRWLALFGSFLVTPLANGGVQVINATTGAQISQLPSIVQDSRFAYGYADNNVVYVVDGKAASICVLKVTAAGVLQFVGRVRAPNCREIVKVVLDENTNGNLFVVCRRRIVRFTVPLSAVTDDDDLLPTFEEDYGVATADYTDLVVIGDNQYWIGQDSVDAATPLDAFYGPMLGVWNAALGDNGELFVAAPRGSIWTVNNVVPYFEEDEIEDTIDVPPVIDPPVVLPDPPVITSSLTASVTEDTLFSYTITATGAGPITYGVTSPPSWLTSIDALTGAISGTPPTAGTENIFITATNSGGTDSETLVLTVMESIADLSDVVTNGDVWRMCRIENMVYMAGSFTTVTDASGTYARVRLACLDISTGLWTAWAPTVSGGSTASRRLYADPAGDWVYLFGSFTDVNGVAATGARRLDPVTGATDSGWTPSADSEVTGLGVAGSLVYMVGIFATLSGASRVAAGAVNLSDGTIASWRPLNGGGSPPSTTNSIGGLQVIGSQIWFGIGTVSNGGSGQNGRAFAQFDATSGASVALTDGLGLASFYSALRLAINGSVVCLVGEWAFPSGQISDNADNDPIIATSRYIAMFTTGGAFLSLTDLNNEGALYDVAGHPSGDFFVGGTFTDIGGDTDYAGIARLDAAGDLVPTFDPAWGSAPNIRCVEIASNGAVIIGGDFVTTLDGNPRAYFAVLNADTGAPY